MEVSDDGLVYTFHLREDAKWSDGEPITADDFVYGWQRLLDPETGALYAFIGEYIKNGYAVETGEVDPSELGVKAIDEKTFEVTLEKPTAYFLSLVGSSGQYRILPAVIDSIIEIGLFILSVQQGFLLPQLLFISFLHHIPFLRINSKHILPLW